VLTLVLRALRAPEGTDVTSPEDYRADQGDPRVRDKVGDNVGDNVGDHEGDQVGGVPEVVV
jgi:Na+/H+-translocating membrane pyrophosphatase